MALSSSTIYIGVNDHKIDLFEGQFDVPNGMAYNSYVILDEKVAITDTVDAAFVEEWLGNLTAALGGRTPDYLIAHHMEPDHSAGLQAFARAYPEATVVATAKAFSMMEAYFGADFPANRLVVKNGDTLNLGSRELVFTAAPMVHWPEVMVTYDPRDKALFSTDAFGKFGALDVEEDWACEARRYYFGIVGAFGKNVQALLKKLATFEIETICPLHGPALTENIDYYFNLYRTWSAYEAESEGVMVAYTSVYGHTKKAAHTLAAKLTEKGCPKVVLCDLAREDMHEAVEDAFRYDRLVCATTTYNGDMFPAMRAFIENLLERKYQNRTVAFMENGSWSPMAAKRMREAFEECANITFAETVVTLTGAPTAENEQQIEALTAELIGA